MKPFWFVWNPNRSTPRYMHYSLQAAKNEAHRLAHATPGQHFVVLESVCATIVGGAQTTDLRPSEEPPF